MVADMRLIEPTTVVPHEVAHPTLLSSRVKEGESTVETRCPDLFVTAACKCERDHRESSDIVDAVAAVAVGNDAVRVLHDADVVGEREQMVGAQARQVQVGDPCRPPPRRELVGFLQDTSSCLGDGRPR